MNEHDRSGLTVGEEQILMRKMISWMMRMMIPMRRAGSIGPMMKLVAAMGTGFGLNRLTYRVEYLCGTNGPNTLQIITS